MGRTSTPKGKSPARGGGVAGRGRGQMKDQRSLDEFVKPRRSTRLRGGDEKIDKIEGPAADLLLEPRDAQTVTLQKRAGAVKEKAKAKQVKKQVAEAEAPPKEKKKVKVAVVDKVKQGLKLKLTEGEQRDLLKNFDLTHVYGPCRGISRRERYLRARRFKLEPLPDDIIPQILDQHEADFTFQKCIWDQNELLKLHV